MNRNDLALLALQCDALEGRSDITREDMRVLKRYAREKRILHPQSNPAYTRLEKRRPIPVKADLTRYTDARDYLRPLLRQGLLLPQLRRHLRSLPPGAIEPELSRRTLARLDPANPQTRRNACLRDCNLMLPKPLLFYNLCYILNCEPLDLYRVTDSPIETAELLTRGY